jgi:hypothetical protein
MAVQVNWDDKEHTILLYTFACTWTWDELYTAIDEGLALTESISHTIYIIVDFQKSRGLPPKAFSHFNHIKSFTNEQAELVVVVGGRTVLLTLFNLFVLIAGSVAHKFVWVPDLNKARTTLAERRSLVIP